MVVKDFLSRTNNMIPVHAYLSKIVAKCVTVSYVPEATHHQAMRGSSWILLLKKHEVMQRERTACRRNEGSKKRA